MQTLGNMPEVGIYPQNRRHIERCTYKNAWIWIYKVESWRWIGRVIEFPCLDNGSIPPTMAGNSISSACSTPLDGINSTLKSWFAPRLVVIIPSFRCVDIFRTRSSKVAEQRAKHGQGRANDPDILEALLFFLFFHSRFDRRRKPWSGNSPSQGSRRKKGRSLVLRSLSAFFILLHTLIFSLYYMYIFFSTPLFLRYFFDRDVRTGLNSRGEFNRESSVIDEGRLHGTRSNNEFAARRMPAANRRSSECQGQNWEVSSIYLPGWMMLEQPRHWMALEYFYKICLNLEKPSSIVFKWGI